MLVTHGHYNIMEQLERAVVLLPHQCEKSYLIPGLKAQ